MRNPTVNRFPWFAALLVAVLVAAFFQGPARAAEPYRLHEADVVRITVVEWAFGKVAGDWTALSREYALGPDGAISIPILGEVPAAGLTTAELAAAIKTELQRKLVTTNEISISIEISVYAPIYVAGAVTTPGAYPYAPGLTVLKAISLAGGTPQGQAAGARPSRDLFISDGEFQVLEDQQWRLIAKRARLAAELKGELTVAMPAEIKDVSYAADLVDSEQAILNANRVRISGSLAALDDLKVLLNNEIVSLTQKRESTSRRVETTRGELDKIKALAEDGLVVSARVSTLEQAVAEVEGQLLDIDSAILRAHQDVSAADQTAADLQNDRTSQLIAERQAADQQLDEIAIRLQTNNLLMQEARALVAGAGEVEQAGYAFFIVREGTGGPTQLVAGENDELVPGDVVKVVLEAQ